MIFCPTFELSEMRVTRIDATLLSSYLDVCILFHNERIAWHMTWQAGKSSSCYKRPSTPSSEALGTGWEITDKSWFPFCLHADREWSRTSVTPSCPKRSLTLGLVIFVDFNWSSGVYAFKHDRPWLRKRICGGQCLLRCKQMSTRISCLLLQSLYVYGTQGCQTLNFKENTNTRAVFDFNRWSRDFLRICDRERPCDL